MQPCCLPPPASDPPSFSRLLLSPWPMEKPSTSPAPAVQAAREEMPTWPSKVAVANTPASWPGAHCTSKCQLAAGGISQYTSPAGRQYTTGSPVSATS